MAIHSLDGKKQLQAFHVGRLEAGALGKVDEALVVEDPTKPFLSPKLWKKSLLSKKVSISPDARIFHFAMSHADQEVGLPIGQHVYLRLRERDGTVVQAEGELVQRAYTPFSCNKTRGELQILIKLYFPFTHPSGSAVPGGRFTMLLEQLVPGVDSIEMKGPLGHLQYLPGGRISLHGHARALKRVAMIAGGSGITPIWSTLKGLLDDPEAKHVDISIIDANRSEEDILARAQLEALIESGKKNGRNIKIWHVLSDEPKILPSWNQGRGRPSIELLREHLCPPPAPAREGELEDSLALLCGPPPMETAVVQSLKDLGWPESCIVRF